GRIREAVLAPDGKRVAIAVGDATVRIWDVTSSRELVVLKGHKYVAGKVAFDPEGKRVVTASGGGPEADQDNTARIWHPESGEERAARRGRSECVKGAAFNPAGLRVLTSSKGGTARVWDVSNGKEIAVLKAPLSWSSTAVAFDRPGNRVLTAGDDGIARIWDA